MRSGFREHDMLTREFRCVFRGPMDPARLEPMLGGSAHDLGEPGNDDSTLQ